MNNQVNTSDSNNRYPSVGQKSLLLIHRDADARALLANILGTDYQVTYCTHKEASPTFLEEQAINLVLLESALLVDIGYDFCQKLTASRTSRDIPLVVVGDRQPQQIAAAFQAGVQDYLCSPFAAEELIARVQARLDDHQRRRQLSQQNGLLIEEVVERKQAQEALQETEAKYRRIFEHATEGIFQTSREGHYINVNPALAQIYGYDSPEELMRSVNDIGKTLYVQPQRRDEITVYLEQFDYIEWAESEVYCKDSNTTWISETIRKVYDEQGNFQYYEGIVHDITERRQMEMELRQQRLQADRLLGNILPYQIAQRLKAGARTIAENFDEVTVLFADLVQFTAAAGEMDAKKLVELLNEVFSTFDRLAAKHGLEKIKTIGDAYMAAAGLPSPRPDHADAVASMALDMQAAIQKFHRPDGEAFQLRIGVSTGPVIAGVIGVRKFAYDLWGDTVNIASRMESTGVSGRIQVTPEVYDCLKHHYDFESRGTIFVKGRGNMESYWLLSRKGPIHSRS
ncbi:MAG: adenylate/guanylate cyclase domain-containing protein [Cyanobacteria bacterium P01_D01_bin.71]